MLAQVGGIITIQGEAFDSLSMLRIYCGGVDQVLHTNPAANRIAPVAVTPDRPGDAPIL
jgi:hypothetical protein